MAQINMPTRQEKKDPLDTLIKGLGIATSIYGIKADMEKAQALKASGELQAQEAQRQREEFNMKKTQFDQGQDDRKRKAAGVVNPVEAADIRKDFDFSDKPVKGSVPLTLKTPQGEQQVYIMPKKKESDPLVQAIRQQTLANMTGNPGETSYKKLPKDQQIKVESLSRDIAAREQIANDIDAALTQLKDTAKTDDEKLLVGRELLKTLNSSQGKDAIGAEEAARLGSLLEFKIIPRIGEPGDMFGRDLEMFTAQVQNNRDRLIESIGKGQSTIDGLLGRDPQAQAQKAAPQAKEAAPQSAKPAIPVALQSKSREEQIKAINAEITKRQGIAGSIPKAKKGGS